MFKNDDPSKGLRKTLNDFYNEKEIITEVSFLGFPLYKKEIEKKAILHDQIAGGRGFTKIGERPDTHHTLFGRLTHTVKGQEFIC